MGDIVGSYYVDISSDGGPDDWEAGQALACEALNTAIDMPASMPIY
jgi:hypothetical protein